MSTYIFDAGFQKERDRLRALEFLFDSYTMRRLADLGVSDGWQCLEVGCGAGSIALWLAEQVGIAGRVVAVDLDTRFLDGHSRANLHVRQHNILDDLNDGPFDLVHARAVLEHIPDRRDALQRMVSAVRPGGWLMLEDTDFGGVVAAALAHYADPPEDAALLERIYRAVEAVLAAAGGDANFGARLIGGLKDAGLENVAGEVHTPVVPGGTEYWVRGTIEQLAKPLVSTGLVTAGDVEAYLTRTADHSCHYAPGFVVTAWGQRPDA